MDLDSFCNAIVFIDLDNALPDGVSSLVLKLIPRIDEWVHWKTRAETMALRLLKSKSKVPVPSVYGYCPFDVDDTEVSLGADDELMGRPTRFAYILMEQVDGIPLSKAKVTLRDQAVREKLMNDLAEIIVDLASVQAPASSRIGHLVTPSFDHVTWQQPDPPSRGSSSWADRTLTHLKDKKRKWNKPPFAGTFTEEQRLFEAWMERVERDGLPSHLAENKHPMVISHEDLEAKNIMVDPETLEVKSIIDWEWAVVAPQPVLIDNALADLSVESGAPSDTHPFEREVWKAKLAELGLKTDPSFESNVAPLTDLDGACCALFYAPAWFVGKPAAEMLKCQQDAQAKLRRIVSTFLV